jgi:archaellum component FlaF (FlaF/FlaG flagellin family)
MNFLLSLLTGGVTNVVIYIKIGLFALAICGAGYFGYSYEHSKFMAYKNEIENIGKAQEAKNEQIVKEQKVTTERITNDYKNQLARVHSYYNGVHNSSSSPVSNVPNATITINGTTVNTLDFAEQCANTTQQLESTQDWIRSQIGLN